MELANYVTQTGKGDKTLLLASGFDLNADKGTSQKVEPSLLVELGKPGEVTIRIKRVSRARVYIHQYTADPLTPQSIWTSENSKNAEHTFTGLDSGARIWLRVIVVDQKGESIYWEPVSRIVQ